MIKALIVEDVTKTADLLEQMIVSLFNDVKVIGKANTPAEAIKMIHSDNPDLVFLDINLKKESGFDILKYTNPDNFELIVTTAHSEHAIEAIKNSVVDYILKPYDFEELRDSINKARRVIDLKNKQRSNTEQDERVLNKISVPTLEGLLLIELTDIVYIKADAGYSEIIVNNESRVVSSKRLNHYEETLNDRHFFRVHKSYIINLKYIKRYQKGRSGSVTMIDGTIIPVAENKKKALMDILKT